MRLSAGALIIYPRIMSDNINIHLTNVLTTVYGSKASRSQPGRQFSLKRSGHWRLLYSDSSLPGSSTADLFKTQERLRLYLFEISFWFCAKNKVKKSWIIIKPFQIKAPVSHRPSDTIFIFRNSRKKGLLILCCYHFSGVFTSSTDSDM